MPKGCPRRRSAWLGPFHPPAVALRSFRCADRRLPADMPDRTFSLPGVGQLTLSAIHHRDVPQLEINVLFLAAVYVLINLVVDLTYGWLDPRIGYS